MQFTLLYIPRIYFIKLIYLEKYGLKIELTIFQKIKFDGIVFYKQKGSVKIMFLIDERKLNYFTTKLNLLLNQIIYLT